MAVLLGEWVLIESSVGHDAQEILKPA
jgi:hypothetical protein